MRSLVFLAAMTPATTAVDSTGPFGDANKLRSVLVVNPTRNGTTTRTRARTRIRIATAPLVHKARRRQA